ncbi:MAG: cation transporter [Flavobacteriaceae bacterium]|jgi:copper chaperone CopZ|nr:cation transporter [Flavobacteriaceae bacterium]HIL86568.1 cation transporter [Candidatus Neomarinimicrobiota bacterium]
MKNILFALIVLSYSSIFSQTQIETFFVNGVCGMCKDRIEKSCIKVEGIKMVNWNLDNRQIKVIYNKKKIDLPQIHSFIASMGHDTDMITASEKSYNSLDECCKYRDENIVIDHKKKGINNN